MCCVLEEGVTDEGDKEFRLAAWQRGADTGRRVAQGQMLRLLKEKLHATQFLAKWATADGLPSDFWDARAAAYADMIGELEGREGRGWWQ